MLSVIRKIRGKFKMDQFLKIITTQYFSHLYYCSTVWLSSETRWNLKKLINTAHYKALRITLRDNKNRINRDSIEKMTKRCTPKEWGLYTSACVAMKVIRDKQPKYFHQRLQETLNTCRRTSLIGHFYNNAKGKIGKQSIENRLAHMDSLKTDWLGLDWNDDSVPINLKKTLFTSYIVQELLTSTNFDDFNCFTLLTNLVSMLNFSLKKF